MNNNLSVVILCRSECYELGKCIYNNSLLKFLKSENIVVVDSSEGEDLNIEKRICDDLSVNFIQKKIGDNNINGIADLRNVGSYNCKTDWILHIDCDELFSTNFLENIDKLINNEDSEKDSGKNDKAWAYRFPRINIPFYEQYPDYQTRLIHKKKCTWEGDIHEVVKILEEPFDHHILKEYPIIHKDKGLRKINDNIRWSKLKTNVLICSLFKDSTPYLNRFLDSLKDSIIYSKSLNQLKLISDNDYMEKNKENKKVNDRSIEIELCFIEGNSKDNTWEVLKKRCKELNKEFEIKYILEKYNINESLARFDKLAILRNMLIKIGLKNKHNYVLMVDSDVIFEKDTIIKLLKSIEKYDVDIVAPLVTIEKFRTFNNEYFYDTLAFIDNKGKNFNHYFPYISEDNDIDSKIDSNKEIKKIISKYPVEIQSVGTCYIAKSEVYNINDFHSFSVSKCYKESLTKNICMYNGNGKSEQIRFFESLRGTKIILDPKIRVLHINLENLGLKWH